MEARWRPNARAADGAPEDGPADRRTRERGMAASRKPGQRLDEAFGLGAAEWAGQVKGRLAFVPWVPSRRPIQPLGTGGLDARRTARLWARWGRPGPRFAARPRFVQPGRLVVLWDVSGSMSAYVPLYLPWLHRLVQSSTRTGVFPFGTELLDATPVLRQPLPRALQALAGLEGPWAGGTSIGEALHQWLKVYGPRWLGGGTTVMVISDGWDSGQPEAVAEGLRRMRQSGAVVYWVNPLAATPGFEPRTRALRAALPYVERLVAGDSPEALLRFAREGAAR
ncbi:VWA domain-containing protein [Alicyclobacillus macrosporangiidus]|uniref:VWFA domain-containing protein n=1 Tax=Alicyclobacillus macrosporangiidus TaxID=392015 RepID=A0A1I7GUW8_9BACL|nr:VWA domain-containing protein [Alicyclobacillus macrosporangiidus]SFU52233.1 hypothetical protein SAMN05421543_10379 [Alicyclobacillus macrosporangiidus]